MSRKWKVLKLYDLENITDLVLILLPTLDELTVEEQLRKQSIDRIQKRSFLYYGAAYIDKETQRWFVFLSKRNSFEQNLLTLAHELAHSFAYEKRNGQLVNVWRTKCKQLENFCDAFAVEWLDRNNNREQLVQILKESAGEDFIYLNNRQQKVLSTQTKPHFIR